MSSMMLWGLSLTNSTLLSPFCQQWRLYYLLRWLECFSIINLQFFLTYHVVIAFLIIIWYESIGCWERDWSRGKAWWFRLLWDWRRWNKGWNTSKPHWVPVFLCKFCCLKQEPSLVFYFWAAFCKTITE